MKIIDLLNKIANGEDVPQKIKIEDKTYTLFIDEDTGYHYYKDDGCKSFMFSISRLERLNDEVEIIEEDKKIKKIKVDYSPDIEEKIFYEDGDKPRHCVLGDAGTELLINKINEIIDYINGGTNG